MNNSDWISNAVPTCFNLEKRFTGVTGVCIKQSYLRPFLNRNLPLKSTPSRTLYSKSLVYIFLDCHKIQLSLKGVLFKPCGSSTPSSHVKSKLLPTHSFGNAVLCEQQTSMGPANELMVCYCQIEMTKIELWTAETGCIVYLQKFKWITNFKLDNNLSFDEER